MAVRLKKEVREVVKIAEAEGFSWNGYLTGSGHVKLRHSNGGTVVIPATPSSYSWRRNAEADLVRVAAGRGKRR
jgi:predicted RNA binding protein YcfA (HicA-like mRNA interferase family)